MKIENVKIISQDNFGLGITKINNKICFVKYGLPDEIININIKNEKSKYLYAVNDNYQNNTLCPYYIECGGCNILHQKYIDQLKFKENKVQELVNRKLNKKINVNDIIASEKYNYRNKIILHASLDKIGFFQDKSNEIVDINNCLLADNKINKIIKDIKKYFLTNRFTGEIKIRSGYKETLVSITGDVKNDIKKYLDVDVLIINGQYLTDKKYIIDKLDDLLFKISDKSFFQVNRFNTINLYNKVIEFYKNNNYQTILDLYCGTGTITLLISKYVKEIIGIEVVKEAIEDANFNKETNKITNANFICGKVEDFICDFKDIDSIIVDPPRSGLDSKTIEHILKIRPKSICYVSCDINTLFRDLKILEEKYEISEITPVDMFPNTYHVECVCIMNVK